MVFVYVPHRSRRERLDVTPEEERAIARLRDKGLAGDDLAAALAGEGVQPERARQLARLGGPRDPRAALAAVGGAFAVLGFIVALRAAEGPLRDWLRHEFPGYEWLAGMAVPLLFLLFILWKLALRRRLAHDAPEGQVRADRIDNRPIG